MARTVSLGIAAVFVNWSESRKFNRSFGADELWIPWDVSLHVRVQEPDVGGVFKHAGSKHRVQN